MQADSRRPAHEHSMRFPPALMQGIDELTRGIAPAELVRASADLTSKYRGERTARPKLDKTHQAAYLISRLPATCAVISRVFMELKERIPALRLESMLDLGSGPGTAMFVVAEHFSELNKIVLVEDVPEWIAIGKRLAKYSERNAVRAAEWQQGSVTQQLPSGLFDVVTISYILNELRPEDGIALASAAWKRANKLLLIMEPGTPLGFERIRQVRQTLIAEGGHIVAPCPHEGDCPMTAGDWCHFSERLERSSAHRHAKSAVLGFEDEKYSYVVVAREPVSLPAARILRQPRKHSGHVELELCTPDGLKRETISKKQGTRYKEARRAGWGDAI